MNADEIVKALARWDGDAVLVCFLCKAHPKFEPHAEDCPWRMAKDWVDGR